MLTLEGERLVMIAAIKSLADKAVALLDYMDEECVCEHTSGPYYGQSDDLKKLVFELRAAVAWANEMPTT